MPRSYGPIMQNGYLVESIDEAAEHWAKRLGVGPFFKFSGLTFKELYLRDAPAEIDMTVAIAYWGDMQIELIEQHCSNETVYSDFARTKTTGLHHVGVETDDIDAAVSELGAAGCPPIWHGEAENGTRFAYVASDFHPGAMVELISFAEPVKPAFAAIKAAAENWDENTVFGSF
ncbi:MAG: VOC family protein [Pseudomonadota bacterium]